VAKLKRWNRFLIFNTKMVATLEDLQSLDRKGLQALAKQNGVKANLKVRILALLLVV